jgi:hypothetical protein
MTTAFQVNAFQNNAFQVTGQVPPVPVGFHGLDQLDMGNLFQAMNTYLGPTLGWVKTFIVPARTVTAGMVSSYAAEDGASPYVSEAGSLLYVTETGTGNVTIGSGDTVIFVNSIAPISLYLPDVALWAKEPIYQPYNTYDRALWIKDRGGNAALANITIFPFGAQTIDLQPMAQIVTNFELLRFYPLNDLTGWYLG